MNKKQKNQYQSINLENSEPIRHYTTFLSLVIYYTYTNNLDSTNVIRAAGTNTTLLQRRERVFLCHFS